MLMLIPLLAASICSQPAGDPPELWMGYVHPERLVTEEHDWDRALRTLAVIQVPINAVAYLTPRDDLHALVTHIRPAGVGMAVECGYFDWDPIPDTFDAPNPKPIAERPREDVGPGIGGRTAAIEQAKLKALIDTYGAPDYLVLDGPMRRLLHPAADTGRGEPHGPQEGMATLEAAAAEVVAYMRGWRRAHPSVQFIVLTNFPNWGWKGDVAYWASGPDGMYWGDYHDAIEALLDACREAELMPVALRADNPLEYTLGEMPIPTPHYPEPARDPSATDWLTRLRELEAYARAKGLAFDLIANTQKGGQTSDEAFARETLRYVRLYCEAGGTPDRWVIQTWYAHPTEVGPESEPFTLAHTINEVAALLRSED
jgi:hypothetical protein